MAIYTIDGPTMPYAWGTRDRLSAFLGRPPTGGPEAELWIGAHPRGPATVRAPAPAPDLAALVENAPEAVLGAGVHRRFGRLPFLLKVLSIGAPLSLQTHPDAAQARAGFSAEETAGVPIDAPERNYKDAFHKPELLVALTPVEALCGFRPPQECARLLRHFDLADADGLSAEIDDLTAHPGPAAMERCFRRFFTLTDDQLAAALERVDRRAAPDDRNTDTDAAAAARWFRAAQAAFGTDPGLLALLTLRHVTLAPGEGIYLPPRRLHAYLSGFGVELMASSDNVLRGGLTHKHVDVPELCRVLDFEAAEPHLCPGVIQEPSTGVRQTSYRTPAAEFALSRVELRGGRFAIPGPALLLVVDGEIELVDEREERPAWTRARLQRGGQALCSGDGRHRAEGRGSFFLATVAPDAS